MLDYFYNYYKNKYFSKYINNLNQKFLLVIFFSIILGS